MVARSPVDRDSFDRCLRDQESALRAEDDYESWSRVPGRLQFWDRRSGILGGLCGDPESARRIWRTGSFMGGGVDVALLRRGAGAAA